MAVMAGAITDLKRIRESLSGVTQEDVARRTRSMNLRTYIRAENGEGRVRYDTALQIRDALNAILQEQGRDPITVDDLGLKLF